MTDKAFSSMETLFALDKLTPSVVTLLNTFYMTAQQAEKVLVMADGDVDKAIRLLEKMSDG